MANLISSIVLVPIMLVKLGAETYGLWIVALAAPAFLAGLDNALCLSVTRETASHCSTERITDDATVRFLSACFGALSVIGLAGGLFTITAASGILLNLHLDPVLRTQVPMVIACVAVAFFVGRASAFGSAVLAGFNRFGTINAISVGALACRFTGFFVLLERHASLSAIAIWFCAVGLLEAAVAVGITYRLRAVTFDRSLWDWAQLRRAGTFGVWSFLTTEVLNLGTYAPAFLLGILTGGTAATTTLYTGQRPGLIISEFNWRGGDILFAASASESEQEEKAIDQSMMLFGTTCVLAVALPLCIGLFILAPQIVFVWLHVARPETVMVMRVTAIGILADALLVSPMHVLWGRGSARTVFVIASGIAFSILLINVLLISRMGATGSAIAFTLSTWIGAIAVTAAALRDLHSPLSGSRYAPFIRLLLPAIVLAVCTQWLSLWLGSNPRLLLITAVGLGGILYATVFFAQERMRSKFRNQ
jgi:O-antigen/teichoic acid export membrane protein